MFGFFFLDSWPSNPATKRTRHQQFRLFWNKLAASAEGWWDHVCDVTSYISIREQPEKMFPLAPSIAPSIGSRCAVSSPSPNHRDLRVQGQRRTRPWPGHYTRAVPQLDDHPMGWSHRHTSPDHCAPRRTIVPQMRYKGLYESYGISSTKLIARIETSTTLVWLRQWQLTFGELYKVSHLTLLRHLA